MPRKIVPEVVRDQELVELPNTATVRDAARLMSERSVGSVLIIENRCLAGIFTERDIVCRVIANGLDPDATVLGEVMTKDPSTIAPDDTAIEALRRMQDGGFRHLPVVESGRVVGIVSRRDFFGEEKARLDEETNLWERL